MTPLESVEYDITVDIGRRVIRVGIGPGKIMIEMDLDQALGFERLLHHAVKVVQELNVDSNEVQ